jgi:hypothetical protein
VCSIEEALAASQETVAIIRRLAETRPDAFLPDLATSLGGLGQALAGAERYADAASAFHEGLAVISPFVEGHAEAFGDLARALSQTYIGACEKMGSAPDLALLERVAKALDGGPHTDEAAVEVLKAKIDIILEAAEKTGELDEKALAELPSGLADQLRAAWAAAQAPSDSEGPDG